MSADLRTQVKTLRDQLKVDADDLVLPDGETDDTYGRDPAREVVLRQVVRLLDKALLSAPASSGWQPIDEFQIEDRRHFLAWNSADLCQYVVYRDLGALFPATGSRWLSTRFTHARRLPAPPEPRQEEDGT